MTEQGRVPESTVLRLSRYHCFLGELQHSGSGRITSREIAEDLGLSEETVRHDLSYVPAKGRPGSGYDTHELYDALCECLDLSAAHPFAAIGNQDVLRGLAVTFPAEDFGLSAAVYFSERAEDAGALVGDQPVHPAGRYPEGGPRSWNPSCARRRCAARGGGDTRAPEPGRRSRRRDADSGAPANASRGDEHHVLPYAVRAQVTRECRRPILRVRAGLDPGSRTQVRQPKRRRCPIPFDGARRCRTSRILRQVHILKARLDLVPDLVPKYMVTVGTRW